MGSPSMQFSQAPTGQPVNYLVADIKLKGERVYLSGPFRFLTLRRVAQGK